MTEDDTERVADGIGKNPETRLAFPRDTCGAQSKQFLLCLVGVAHSDVQVHLLRVSRVGPPRRNPISSVLESQLAQTRPGTDDYPAAGIFVDPHPQHPTVELRKSLRVGAVDHRLLKASDHPLII